MSDDQRTIGSIDRAGFLATAAVGTGATLLGAAPPAGLGAPHAPFVAESDARIVVERPAVQSAGRSLETYAAAPHNATATTPGVVVIQAIWGVDAQLRDVVRRLAVAGYRAVAPNLYTGLDAPSGDGAADFQPFRAVADKLVDATVDADVASAVGLIRTRAGKPELPIGTIGFCMGGGICLRQTVDAARIFRAASVFYGKVRYGADAGPIVPIDLAYASDVGVPVVGSWGGKDTSIKPEDVRSLDAELGQLGHVHDFKIYEEAGHAFFDDTRPSYVGSAAEDAWQRTLGWFGRYLR